MTGVRQTADPYSGAGRTDLCTLKHASCPSHHRRRPIRFALYDAILPQEHRQGLFGGNGMKFETPGPTFRRTIRRKQLREMVPLADSTIYEKEQRGEFPRRFALSPRCVVWDLGEVEA